MKKVNMQVTLFYNVTPSIFVR